MNAVLNKIDIKPWTTDPELKAVLSAITKDGKEARFVGGCVRNYLLKQPVHDIDIATQELPERVVELLNHAGIKALPTGIKHGTIMAVARHKTFEITTLRSDIRTDGRHAIVEFTEDWEKDASRRDFTVNALSVNLEGKLFDYFNGRQDLKSKILRFIGHAPERIKEDQLRILRYFRIIETLGFNIGDQKELDACIDQASTLKKLSGERIRSELFKILCSKLENNIITIMYENGILNFILPYVTSPARLKQLSQIEAHTQKTKQITPDPIRRLSSLIEADASGVAEVTDALKLSKNQQKRLTNIKTNTAAIFWNMPNNKLQRAIFKLGNTTVIDLALHNWANMLILSPQNTEEIENGWLQIISTTQEQQSQELLLPIKGQDVLDLGIPPSYEISKLLKQVEVWWLNNSCTPDRKKCLKKLKLLANFPSARIEKSEISKR